MFASDFDAGENYRNKGENTKLAIILKMAEMQDKESEFADLIMQSTPATIH